jgi:hypothetical protein
LSRRFRRRAPIITDAHAALLIESKADQEMLGLLGEVVAVVVPVRITSVLLGSLRLVRV